MFDLLIGNWNIDWKNQDFKSATKYRTGILLF